MIVNELSFNCFRLDIHLFLTYKILLNNRAHSNSVKFTNFIIINVCINVHSVNIVKLLTLTLSWIILILSFNDTGLTVLVVNCRPTRLYVRGI